MPPNKDSKYPPLTGIYSVEEMNIEELKNYIGALKEETETLKESLAFHQRDKSELLGLLQNSENASLTKFGNLIQRDVEMQGEIMTSHLRLKEEEKKNLISVSELKEKEAKCSLELFTRIQNTKSQFNEEEHYLKKAIEEVKREITERKLDHKFTNLREEEKKDEHYWSLIQEDLEKIRAIVSDASRNFHIAKRGFFDDKMCKMKSIWETLLEKVPIEDSISKYAEEMSIYFKEVFCENIERILILSSDVNEREKELNKLKLQIRDAKRCNKKFLTDSCKKSPPLKVSADNKANTQLNNNKRKDENLKCNQIKLSDLFYENDVLKNKLKLAERERDCLRRNFTSAMRRIYNKADFKSYLMEQILISFQNKKGRNRNFSSVYYAVLPKKQMGREIPEATTDSNHTFESSLNP